MPPSSRGQLTHGVIEVQNQNLCGSEPSINSLYEGGTERLLSNWINKSARVRNQNMYGSKSSVDLVYEGGNLRPIAMPLGENQIVLSPTRNDDDIFISFCIL